MSTQSFMKVLEALHEMAEEAGASDEFTRAIFDFCTMLMFYGMKEETKAYVDKCVKVVRDTLDGVPMRMIREDKLN